MKPESLSHIGNDLIQECRTFWASYHGNPDYQLSFIHEYDDTDMGTNHLHIGISYWKTEERHL